MRKLGFDFSILLITITSKCAFCLKKLLMMEPADVISLKSHKLVQMRHNLFILRSTLSIKDLDKLNFALVVLF